MQSALSPSPVPALLVGEEEEEGVYMMLVGLGLVVLLLGFGLVWHMASCRAVAGC